MAQKDAAPRPAEKEQGHLDIEARGAVVVARIDGGPRQVFGPDLAAQLAYLVYRVDRDPEVRAVVFTGTHPDRFISHAEVRCAVDQGAVQIEEHRPDIAEHQTLCVANM